MVDIFQATLCAIFIFIILWYLDDKLISGRNLPPGPFRVPILGSVELILAGLRGESPYVTFRNWREKYGPIFTTKFGSMLQCVVDDPATIKEILSGDNWVDRPSNKYIKERSYGKPLGVLWASGESWKELRRFSIRTLRDFGFGKQMSQERMMAEELKELLEGLNETLQQEGNIVNMESFFSVSVLNIVWSMIAGVRFSYKDKKMQELVRNISATLRQISGGGNIMMAFPFLYTIFKHFPGRFQERKLTVAKLQKYFEDILIERRKEGYYKDDQRDYIDVFLTEIDKSGKTVVEIFTDQQFVTTLIDLFVAGSDTTANTSEFGILYMILNPTVQQKVQEEIDRVVGRNRYPNALDRPNMPYTEATIYEIQRLANIVPLIPRTPTKDVNVKGHLIKKGTFTVLNLFSYHHNSSIFENASQFQPERFLDSNNCIINTEKLQVFGGGKRVCLGEVLARATLFNYFATLMQNYTFEASPMHPKPTAENPRFGLTMTPQPYFALIKHR